MRDYGTGLWDGGDENCDHQRHNARAPHERRTSTLGGGTDTIRVQEEANVYREVCGKCGARRIDNQLGLEPTPDLYVARMVAVFREVRRVLAAHGTCWVNMGDGYVAGQGGRQSSVGEMPTAPLQRTNEPRDRDDVDTGAWASRDVTAKMTPARGTTHLKPKDLVGMPWRLAFALQTDGWYLRSDIIWSKLNPMPESVTDRPTKAHEYVFLLSKWPRYFFDQEAVREPAEYGRREWTSVDGNMAGVGINGQRGRATVRDFRQPPQDETLDPSLPHEAPRGPDGRRATRVVAGEGSIQHRDGERWPNSGRNIRSVWEIATQPYAEAHFATFPEELVRRCVLAGCPEWVCGVCGKPRERIVEESGNRSGYAEDRRPSASAPHPAYREHGASLVTVTKKSLGWSDCGHGSYRAGVVLDPFMGSGTTALVARNHGRHAVGIDLNPAYLEMAARRLQQLSLLAEQAS